MQAASGGGAIAWFTYIPLEGSYGGFYELSRRTAAGWSAPKSMTPPTSTGSSGLYYCTPSLYFSADLAHEALEDGYREAGMEGYCPSNEPELELVSGAEPKGAQDVFARDASSGPYRLVNVTPPGATPANAYFEDASADFSRIFFEEEAQLTSQAPSGENLYEWAGGVVHLVTVLPGNHPVNGAIVDASGPRSTTVGVAPYLHAVSAEGTRAFFKAQGNLYTRVNPEAGSEAAGTPTTVDGCGSDACTIQLDASAAGGPGGGGRFLAAAADGSVVFFTDGPEAKLTSDTQEGSGANLYEYDLQTGALRDMTAAAQADVLGVSGIGGEGAYLYFVAEGALTAGATAGQPNLYVAHEGHLTFIATLNGEDHQDWETNGEWLPARVASSGEYFAFDSGNELTGYHNTDAVTGKADTEVFLYSAASSRLTCVSCNPNGAAPIGPSSLTGDHRLLNEPGPGDFQLNVLDDGRVFFDSADALVSSDINHRYDVYEYAEGAPRLISSGTGSEDAYFADASKSGEDVFFVTGQGLIGADADNQLSLYDARVNGGFPESSPAISCSGDGCRAAQPPAPALAVPSSVIFSGPGNMQSSSTRGAAHKNDSRSHHLKRKRRSRHTLRRCRHGRTLERRLCTRQVRRWQRVNGARGHHRSKRRGVK